MTILPEIVVKDERFGRCLNARQSGRVAMKYAPPFPTLEKLEKRLAQLEVARNSTSDVGIHDLADYMRDFVELLQRYRIGAESLEMALQEFAVKGSTESALGN